MQTKRELNRVLKEIKRDTGKVKGMSPQISKVNKAANKNGF